MGNWSSSTAIDSRTTMGFDLYGFISGFPNLNNMSSVMVIVDQFTKYIVFVPTPAVCTVEKVVELFNACG